VPLIRNSSIAKRVEKETEGNWLAEIHLENGRCSNEGGNSLFLK